MAGKKRHTKTDLLQAGLDLLARHGSDALTIEVLCSGLGVTKGSFYHHFPSRNAFSRELLAHWEGTHTRFYIESSQDAGTAAERYRALYTLASDIDVEVEAAVRAWALRDPEARKVQERVDRMRLEYLARLYSGLLSDPEQAEAVALLSYAAFIGLRQIMPRPDHSLLVEASKLWRELAKTRFKEVDHAGD